MRIKNPSISPGEMAGKKLVKWNGYQASVDRNTFLRAQEFLIMAVVTRSSRGRVSKDTKLHNHHHSPFFLMQEGLG